MNSFHTRIRALPVVCLLVVASSASAQTTAPPAGLDELVTKVMTTFEVPGLALSIVKDGKVVVAKGYGVRKLGDAPPVDSRTLFGIASNTKVFTATALGLLAEEGKVEWDAPVVKYLPWFRMSDPYVTHEITIRDLLVHRSGLSLGAGDLLWWPESTYNRKEIARRIAFIPLSTSFRSAYAYDNVLYLVAGEVIEAVSGQSWEDFVRTRILERAGMAGSSVRHSAAAGGGNIATPHARVEGKVRPVAPFASDNTNPAGGINASAEDMAKWLNVLLARGKLPDGSRLFTEGTYRQLTTLVTPLPNPDPPAEVAALKSGFRGYALGLEARDYRGHKMLTHTGGLPGYVSKVTHVPDVGLGVSVLTNQESGEAFSVITYWILDQYLKTADTDWLAAYKTLAARAAANVEGQEKTAAAQRNAASRPSLPLEKYAGTYRDQWYGDVVITSAAGKLGIKFAQTPSLTGELEHWQYDTFVARWTDRELRADAYVTFSLNPDGSIDRVRMKPFSPTVDFSFDFQDLVLAPVKQSGS